MSENEALIKYEDLIFCKTIVAVGGNIKDFFGNAAGKIVGLEAYSSTMREYWGDIRERLEEASQTRTAQNVHLQYTGGCACATTQDGTLELRVYRWSETCPEKMVLEQLEKSLKESDFTFEYVEEATK